MSMYRYRGAKKMDCTLCGKNKARFFYMEISGKDGIVKEYLCDKCVIGMPGIHNFLDSYLNNQKFFRNKKKICPVCGLTQNEWEKSGFAGCAFCYKVFRKEIISDIKKYHNGSSHSGKKPANRIFSGGKSRYLRNEAIKMIPLVNCEQINKKKRESDGFVNKKHKA